MKMMMRKGDFFELTIAEQSEYIRKLSEWHTEASAIYFCNHHQDKTLVKALLLEQLTRTKIIENLAHGILPNQDKISQEFGVSAPTGRRLLARLGINYQAIVDEERIKLANQLLPYGFTTTEMAKRLAFSKESSFSRWWREKMGGKFSVTRDKYYERLSAGA